MTALASIHRRGCQFLNGTATFLALLLQLSCGGHSETASGPTTPSSTVSVSSLTVVLVQAGSEYQATAVAAFSDGSSKDVTADAQWSSSDPNVAAISGTGRVTAVAGGTVDIRASYQGRTGSASLTVSAPPGPTSPTPPTGQTFTLSGTVRDDSTTAPLAGAEAEIIGGPDAGKKVTTDSTGKYAFAGLSAGTFQVYFRSSGYETSAATVTLSGDQTLDVALHQTPPPSTPQPSPTPSPSGEYAVTVRTINASNVGLPGIQVTVLDGPKTGTAASGAGDLVVLQLPAGPVTLRISAATYAPTERTVQVTGPMLVEVRLDDYLVVFDVLDAQTGRRIGGQLIVLDGLRAGTTASGEGHIRVRLLLGTVAVRITRDGYLPTERRVDVDERRLNEDGAIREEVRLEGIPYTYSGVVRDSLGVAVVGVSVCCSPLTGQAVAVTDANGRYEFRTTTGAWSGSDIRIYVAFTRDGYESVDDRSLTPGGNNVVMKGIVRLVLVGVPATVSVGTEEHISAQAEYDTGETVDVGSTTPLRDDVYYYSGNSAVLVTGKNYYWRNPGYLRGVSPGTVTVWARYRGVQSPAVTVQVVP